MGRLFWKFFFVSWLALLTASVAVGTAVWWRHQLLEQDRLKTETSAIDRHAGLFVDAAAEVLRHGGEEALKQFLQQPHEPAFPQVYAVDDAGRDLGGRGLSEYTINQVRSLFNKRDNNGAIRKVTMSDSRQYLLFVLLPEDWQRFSGSDEIPPPPPPFDLDKHRPPPGPPGGGPPKPPSWWLPMLSATLASLLLSAALAWYFAKPIRSLRTAFAAAANGKLSVRIAETMTRRNDELADLGRDFDDMAARLESLITAQQRLLHDVSHELRSPLARMQAAIGLAQQQPEKTPDTLTRLERESQRISDLVGELLILSRLESGGHTRESAETEIGGLLADIVDNASFEAEQKQVGIHFQGVEENFVKTDGELLYRAVENVLRNAVQHCPAPGEVRLIADFDVRVQRLLITIDDQGPGVPEEELSEIFQPFFRSKNHRKPGGTGLGLTIAQRAIEALGGRISASNRLEGGLHVEIELRFDRG